MLKSFIIIINDDIYFMLYLLFMYFMFVVRKCFSPTLAFIGWWRPDLLWMQIT